MYPGIRVITHEPQNNASNVVQKMQYGDFCKRYVIYEK